MSSYALPLAYNKVSERYETIDENDIIYKVPPALVESLKTFYRKDYRIAVWYKRLSEKEKQTVVRRNLLDKWGLSRCFNL